MGRLVEFCDVDRVLMGIRCSIALFLAVWGWMICAPALAAVTFDFNYDFDDEGFFDDPVHREILEFAGDTVLRWRDRRVPPHR